MDPRGVRGLPCSPRVNALRLLVQPPRRNGETHRSRIVTFGSRGDRQRDSPGYAGVAQTLVPRREAWHALAEIKISGMQSG